jgi:4-hydroxy-tetrahydrodipicolinate reductase
MKILLIGYGRMGKEIEKAARGKAWEIVHIIDKAADWEQDEEWKAADVAIDFSIPEAAAGNILRCFDASIPIVCGTTGWLDQLDIIREACHRHSAALVYAPNFSKGVNLFFRLNQVLATWMEAQAEYDVKLKEFHHVHKLDAPSGTALKLGQDIIEVLARKSDWKSGPDVSPDQLEIRSVRNSEIPGTHKIDWVSEADEISLIHRAKSRTIFVSGALEAAEWIIGRKGVFTYQEVLFGAGKKQ